MLKRGDTVIAIGYLIKEDEDGKDIPKEYPDFLLQGIHRISITKDIGYQTLVKTDRQPIWLSSK